MGGMVFLASEQKGGMEIGLFGGQGRRKVRTEAEAQT